MPRLGGIAKLRGPRPREVPTIQDAKTPLSKLVDGEAAIAQHFGVIPWFLLDTPSFYLRLP